MVELHSVIAELTKQVEQKSRERIDEEDMFDDYTDDETSDERCAKNDVVSRTSTDVIDAAAVEAGQRFAAQIGGSNDLCSFLKLSRSMSRSIHSSTTSLQMLALQEELSDAKQRNILLTARLQQRESDFDQLRKDLESMANDKAKLRERIKELEQQQLSPALVPSKIEVTEPQTTTSTNDTDQEEDATKMKLAERKKIKRMDEFMNGSHPRVTGSDLSSVGVRNATNLAQIWHTLFFQVRNSVVVEHLVQEFQDKSSMQEFSHSFTANPLSDLTNVCKNGGKKKALFQNFTKFKFRAIFFSPNQNKKWDYFFRVTLPFFRVNSLV